MNEKHRCQHHGGAREKVSRFHRLRTTVKKIIQPIVDKIFQSGPKWLQSGLHASEIHLWSKYSSVLARRSILCIQHHGSKCVWVKNDCYRPWMSGSCSTVSCLQSKHTEHKLTQEQLCCPTSWQPRGLHCWPHICNLRVTTGAVALLACLFVFVHSAITSLFGPSVVLYF